MADRTWLVVSAVSGQVYVPSTQGTWPAPPIDRAVLVVPRTSLPPVLTVEEAWAVPGAVLVFSPSALVTAATLAKAVGEFLADPARGATAAIWVQNPADAPRRWRAQVLPVTARAGIGGEIAGLATLRLRNLALRIPGGSRLTVLDQPGRWRIDPPGQDSLAFTARYGAVVSNVAGPLTISLGPDRPGVAQFGWTLTGQLEQAFDVGLHYFAEEPELPGSGLLRGPRLALTPGAEPGQAVEVSVDPLALTDPARSFVRLTPPPEALECTFRDQVGNALTLTPHDDFRLAFMTSPGTASPGAEDPLCMTPVGGADVGAADALLPGLSAAELVSLGEKVALHLEPGGAALAVALGQGGSNAALSRRATTSWVRLAGDERTSLRYFAQPTGAELYSAPATGDFAPFLPLPAAWVEASTSLPMAPWAGADPLDTAFDTSVEAAGIAPARRALLSGGGRPPAGLSRGGGPTSAVTPQGLVASVAADGSLDSLRLAKIGETSLSMAAVNGPLLEALMTATQFVVLSDSVTAARYLASSKLTVDQWTFTVDAKTWAAHKTMLVIKNCPRSVRDLAGEPAAWAQAAELNPLVNTAAQRLTEFVAETIARAATDPVYEPIRQALEDPAWNGILFLNATVPLNELPDTLSGVAPGIDPARFFAHHIRIDRTPVQRVPARGPVAGGPVAGGPVPGDADDSSVFALIDYTATAPLFSVAPYAFQIDNFRVLIENSKVSAFKSGLTLLVNQLFDAPVTDKTGQLEFTGHYQKQQDSYFFALAPDGQRGAPGRPVMKVADATVKTFTVTGGSYATVKDPSSQDDAETGAQSRFSLDGELRLADTSDDSGPNGGFDLFGFEALAVTGIAVDVRFDHQQPQFAKFGFDPASAQIDAPGARAREGSLPANFPVVARSFIAAAAGQDPAQLAAMPVAVPATWTGPSAPWYALAFDFDLGTVGALAGSSALIARLYLQWSPSPDAGRWAVRLGLPGATGGSTSISLMGVLKVSIYAVSLLILESGAFMLALEGIALTVLSRSVPPGGTLTLALLGDPNGAKPAPLSWYGAYLADKGSAVAAPAPTATIRRQ